MRAAGKRLGRLGARPASGTGVVAGEDPDRARAVKRRWRCFTGAAAGRDSAVAASAPWWQGLPQSSVYYDGGHGALLHHSWPTTTAPAVDAAGAGVAVGGAGCCCT
ncbi:hypothetical protein M8494_00815 [Serratia ureilytica]